ncbi:Rqc2 family fibronectin-binding protein [Eubacterium callanderi]|uniref:Rqc2 family fibronectin-binding protein n=2 Tax=Eubacteriaceae TaxID=186806 RepID=UPI0012B1BB5E|nr:NFACT RNA binding domain-containing protein [Eubacterium callanderi]MSS93185.1 fibronectin/fibrinogen-binding protein [Eubacterium sp. BL-380-WT-2B]
MKGIEPMAFDGITTKHLIKELQATIMGGRIRKIYQPENDEIRMTINREKENYNLLISANANNPRAYLSEKLKENPNTPPSFCMVLRKHLLNGIIVDIVQHETDRVIEFSISGKNEFNDVVIKKLMVEIMGRNSNVILIDDKTNASGETQDSEDIILDAMKKVGSGSNRYRQILPGKAYIYPPESGRQNFLSLTEARYHEMVAENAETVTERFWVQCFLGLSPIIAREFCFRAGLNPELKLREFSKKQLGYLYQAFREVMDEIEKGPDCGIYYFRREIIDFSTVSLHHMTDNERSAYTSVSKMLEAFYYIKDKKIRFKAKSANLRHQLDTLLKKNYKKLQNLHQDMDNSKKNEKNKLYGDLITANIYRIEKGMETIELVDYTDPEMKTVKVHLKVNETPSQNAQRFYKKYNKGKRAQIQLAEQIKTTEEQVYYLESLTGGLDQSTELNELDEIRHEFMHSEFNKKGLTPKEAKKKVAASKPLHFISSEGFDIFVGKNNYQNDYISTRLGVDEDCWLHVKDIPGSHVLVVAKGRFITEDTLLEAGMLAAWHSKAKNSENVPVDYVEFKYLKKPKKSKPGMVIFTNQNTMYVTPSKDKITAIRQVFDSDEQM